MAMQSKVTPLLFALILLGGFVAYLFLEQPQPQKPRGGFSTPVKVEQVALRAFPITIDALGTAKANESVTVTAQETEVITQVKFDDGEYVEAGQLLVQLNNDQEQARVRELEANISEAKRQYERIRNLAKSSAASQQLLDEQQARVKVLLAQLEVARAQLRDLEIRAPFSGYLGIRAVSNGSLVRPADVITTLDDTRLVKVDFSVAEKYLASLSSGQRVTATSVAYPDTEFEGKISTVDSRIDPVSRSILVRAIIDNPDNRLRPGMLLKITLEKQVLQALVMAEKALVPVEDKQYVFVLAGDKVEQREVQIGERRPGWVQILAGLEAGEQVVTEGTLRVRDQSPVRVLNGSEG
ncbi:efflux RND transporter periplasmic adaptor subunit [Alteromonas aestuariivivens]|uniref:Efflux RND transporter periplasmic adaptor subunit n=1 Tax=Alteromonas aestuariivivens TaxID=1938339 RepID=A0A3D8MCS3_9ALTE|nr:efflux RND transporter periplasmic adaptor subunit [Alteromonas aestuariivivens]RDV28040.1 efflux RND transporter periplasmic adaptor subunit [Alteromonas aestuariivivens]